LHEVFKKKLASFNYLFYICSGINKFAIMVTTYNKVEMSPVDALWTLIQGQTKAVRAALIKRLLEQEKATIAAKAVDAKMFTQKINALENDSEGFFKLGGFMADSGSSADELLEEALTDKYGI
jgi:hypothetical protein